MSLQSTWFSGNARLQRCLISDPSHVQKGDCGDHVTLIQGALLALDNSEISRDEQAQKLYGESTRNAVLEFKKKRKIINFSYQNSADSIVGRMTIQSLDTEMLAQERGRFRFLLAFGITLPKMVILDEGTTHSRRWATQVQEANKPHVVVIQAPRKASAEKNVEVIKQAIVAAAGGFLIFSVGHGFCLVENRSSFTETGAFDIAPDAAMRIEGKNMDTDPGQFVNVFYDDKPPQTPGGGLKPFSRRDKDLQSGTDAAAKNRLKNFSIYQDLSQAFVAGKLGGVLLATCRVGRATGLLQKVATQWNTPILAYRDQWLFFETPSRRTRAILAGDQGREKTSTPGTNTPFGEVMFPLSMFEMVHLRP